MLSNGLVSEDMLYTLLIAFVIVGVLFNIYRSHVRRNTLHRRDDGTYVWIEWHGGERSSRHDPTEISDTDGCGGGDGGD